MRAPVPYVVNIPRRDATYEKNLAQNIYVTELVLLKQKHNWRHVSRCFKSGAHIRRRNCRYSFPRKCQYSAETTEDVVVCTERAIGSEYVNNFDPILLQVVRSNHDIRFLTSSAHEIHYVLKYAVKNQIDIATAVTLASYMKKLEKEKESTDERNKTQLVYGSIASTAYARSNMHEVGAVTAVHYFLHGRTFVSSHDFEKLHLGRHLNDLNESENSMTILKNDGTYFPFNITETILSDLLNLRMKIFITHIQIRSECRLYAFAPGSPTTKRQL